MFLQQDYKSEKELYSAFEEAESKTVALLHKTKEKIPVVTLTGQTTWKYVPVSARNKSLFLIVLQYLFIEAFKFYYFSSL